MEKIYGYISKKFKKKVLENAKESDQIIIITGYFSPDMIDEIAKWVFHSYTITVCMV